MGVGSGSTEQRGQMEEIEVENRGNDTAGGKGLEAIEFLWCFQQAATRVLGFKEEEVRDGTVKKSRGETALKGR